MIKCVLPDALIPTRLTSSRVPRCSIRNRLTALKKDRGEYIKQSDVNALYQAIIKQGARRSLYHSA